MPSATTDIAETEKDDTFDSLDPRTGKVVAHLAAAGPSRTV